MLSLGILTTSLSRQAGGLFQSVRRSAIALHQAGIDVTVYGIEDQHTAEDLNAWEPLEPKVFQRVGPAALGYGRGLGRAVRWGGHDVLHLHGIWQANSFETVNARMPVMISPRGMLDSWAVENSRLKKRLFGAMVEKKNLHRATCLHA
ncbi:MAG: glycosyltransferase, partial [Pseudomonadota bacterium]